MTYLTAQQAADKWNISKQQVIKYITQGRIPGAKQFGDAPNAPWQIPAKAKKPKARKPGRKTDAVLCNRKRRG